MPTPRKHSTNADRQRAYRQRTEEARRAALEAKGLPAAPAVPTIPGTRRWTAMKEQAELLLREIVEEMETYRDERSDQWQESEKGEEFEQKITEAQEAVDAVENLTLK